VNRRFKYRMSEINNNLAEYGIYKIQLNNSHGLLKLLLNLLLRFKEKVVKWEIDP
jgi:hypothetical protein